MAVLPSDVDEKIRPLGNPPIVEAAIHWQARARKPFDLEGWKSGLSERLVGYGTPETIHQLQAMLLFQADEPAVSADSKQFVDGLRFTSDDKLHIAQIKRDGVVFSRLKPYENWERFTEAALRIWRIYLDFALPDDIQRLGVRFINQIPLAGFDSLGRVLDAPPTCPANLPLNEFVYQSTFLVPNQPYAIRVIKLMQPQARGGEKAPGLFVDCDVYSTKPISREPKAIDEALADMRLLKNRIFFSLLTEDILKQF